MVHDHSLAAYYATTSQRYTLEQRILGLMADCRPRSDREIQQELGHAESLRPRICSLVKQGYLHEVGSKVCEVTHIRVRLTRRFL